MSALTSNLVPLSQLIARLYEPGAAIGNEEYDLTTTLVMLDLENEELQRENGMLRQRVHELTKAHLKPPLPPGASAQSFGHM